ncbi:MAG: hypothetical protein AAB223_05135 [Pseudomonadota bacterium]
MNLPSTMLPAAPPASDPAGDRLEPDSPATEALRQRAHGSNVNEQTLLATDYLNHFNEVVMLLEMLPDMPEMLGDVKAWQPKPYQDHFRTSTIADKELAIEAYDHAPKRYREPFDLTVNQINRLIAVSIQRLEADVGRGEPELLRANVKSLSRIIQRLMDVAGGIIHGSQKTMAQDEIDNMIGH